MQIVLRHPAYWNSAKTLVLAPGFDRSSRSTKLHLFGRLPLAAPFLPFASRARIVRDVRQDFSENPALSAHLMSICLYELLELRQLETESAAHFYKWNPALVYPAVKRRGGDSQEFCCILHIN